MIEAKDRKGLRTWIEIDTKVISHNILELKKNLPPDVKCLSVVKSNAYGHSLVDFSLEVEKIGVDYFGVDSIVEAISMRNVGIKTPILVLGYTLPEMITKALEFDIDIAVSTFECISEIIKLNLDKKIKIHIKIDTGMHRQGFQESQIDELISVLKSSTDVIFVTGLFTHFAAVKNPVFIEYTQKQLESFKVAIYKFNKNSFSPIIHASASGGLLVFPEANFDMVRFGIGQYGIWPADEVRQISEVKVNLKPILEWKTLLGEIKKIEKGSRIGYDLTHELNRDSVIAVCPIGYWHGYPRSLSDRGTVLVNGKKVPVLGRVSMDMIVIDITEVEDAKVGDVVTLIGSDSSNTIEAYDLATMAGCSVYELVTRINPLIKRIYR